MFCGCHKNEAEQPVENAAAIGCANSLRQIVQAKEHWAKHSGEGSNATPTWADLNSYFRHPVPPCPEGGAYTIGTLGELPKCSIASHNDFFVSHQKPGP